MKWRLYLLRREANLWLICKPFGHKITMSCGSDIYADAEYFSGRCSRCDRIWPRVLTVTRSFATSAERGWERRVEREVVKKAAELKHARVLTKAEHEGMFAE